MNHQTHDLLCRWGTLLDAQYASPEALTTARDGLDAAAKATPDGTALYMAGVLYSIMQTLPADDPWRNITAVFTGYGCGQHIRTALNGTRPQVYGDQQVTATLNGSPFGTPRDGIDMTRSPYSTGPDPAPELDPGIAALAPGLSPWAAVLLAFATEGDTARPDHSDPDIDDAITFDIDIAAVTGLSAIIECINRLPYDGAGVRAFADAVRWAAWRHGCHTGSSGHPGMTAVSWLPAAQHGRLVGGEWLTNRGDDIAHNRVRNGAWTAWQVYNDTTRQAHADPFPPGPEWDALRFPKEDNSDY